MAVHVIEGDVRLMLPFLETGSVQTCVTSPPYYGLRDYGVDGQLGLESSVDEYVEQMVRVFAEVRRVLRDDGTLWLNLGDSYASHDPGGYREGEFLNPGGRPPTKQGSHRNRAGTYRPDGLKKKDLIGVPWRVAFALQADGWYLRSDIIWSKPNPMPESVRDRPTKSHEYIFLLTKKPTYYWDAEAVKESSAWGRENNPDWQYQRAETNARKGAGNRNAADGGFTQWQPEQGRNIRSVWTIATHPYAEAHFATFPPSLAERCIKAGTSEKGACSACGAPWVRVTENGQTTRQTFAGSNGQQEHPPGVSHTLVPIERVTVGWQPACTCDAAITPCVVLDPFGGAGTTGLVADRLGRHAVLIELNPEYAAMARKRIAGDAPMFAEVS